MNIVDIYRYFGSIFTKNSAHTKPILDVMSQGDDREEAKKNLSEALFLFFITCYENETLDKVMKDSGFTFSPDVHVDESYSEQEFLDVQIPFVSPEYNISECNV